MIQRLTLRRPDDMHLHLRDGAMLQGIIAESARHFARAIIMPNLVPPVVTAAQAAAYRDRILAALPVGAQFEPLMTLYLTETTDPADVAAAHASGLIKAVKLYPAGATTNSHSGVQYFDAVRPVLEKMADIGLPRRWPGPCRQHHHASPDPEPQPHPRRGDQAALLLPARRQTRIPPSGPAASRHFRRGAVFPWHRFRPACGRAERT